MKYLTTLDSFPGIQANALRLAARLREDLASLDEIISALALQYDNQRPTPRPAQSCRSLGHARPKVRVAADILR